MLKKNERMEKLNNAGVNTSKYFSVALDNGTKIHLIIDENGNVTQAKNNPIAEQIIEDGYVRNTKLHRRFVMAQMFYMLNYVSWDGYYRGYNECLKRAYGYSYTIKMMVDEVKVLSKLETRDIESFSERRHFFTKEVIVSVLADYLDKLKQHVEDKPTYKCKGVPYKKIQGNNIFVEDLDKKIYNPILLDIARVKSARNYFEIHKVLVGFMRKMIKLPHNTPKSKDWIDAYKGAGAYYTLKNMVMFHDCAVPVYGTRKVVEGIEAVEYLNKVIDEYKGEGYKMFALMNKVIEYNNFDFNKRMNEVYNK